jgi:putative addiction module killer protein
VEARPRIVTDYRTEDGRSPFHEWLDEYGNQPIVGIILARLVVVARGSLGEHDPVGSGVWELKIRIGPGFRVYYGEDGDLVVLLFGGTKRTQVQDIKTAKRYWEDYNA